MLLRGGTADWAIVSHLQGVPWEPRDKLGHATTWGSRKGLLERQMQLEGKVADVLERQARHDKVNLLHVQLLPEPVKSGLAAINYYFKRRAAKYGGECAI